MSQQEAFPFRPWVRSTCRRALVWGMGVVAVLGGLTWLLRDPDSRPLGRAFGALVFYGLLFCLSLAKIWWTAGRPAVLLERDTLGYQPLHTFRPRRVAFDRVLACAPRAGTQSLRVVHLGRRERPRELFLNLGVVQGRHRLMEALGSALERAGLEPAAERPDTWLRPGADDLLDS